MNNEEKKKEIAEIFGSMDIQVDLVDFDENQLRNSNVIPLSDIIALGLTFKNTANIIARTAIAGKQLWKMDLPSGVRKTIGDSLGLGPGAAALSPYLMVTAVTLVSINRKMDKIESLQRDILAFLEIKEKTDLMGNFDILCDINNGYKRNWDNQEFRRSNHNLVLNIKRNTRGKIGLYRSQLSTLFRNNLIYTSGRAKEEVNKAYDLLRTYQLAIYVYVFSIYLDMLFVENYESEHLNDIVESINSCIDEHNNTYRMLYSNMEEYLNKTVEAIAAKIGKRAVKTAKSAIRKIPFRVPAKISAVGEETNEEEFSERQKCRALSKFDRKKELDVSVFLENIDIINTYYNHSHVILFNNENIYLPCSDVSE